jgi:hypothetical protein
VYFQCFQGGQGLEDSPGRFDCLCRKQTARSSGYCPCLGEVEASARRPRLITLLHLLTSISRPPSQRLPEWVQRAFCVLMPRRRGPDVGAGDGIRTHGRLLGKQMRYHCATPASHTIALVTRFLSNLRLLYHTLSPRANRFRYIPFARQSARTEARTQPSWLRHFWGSKMTIAWATRILPPPLNWPKTAIGVPGSISSRPTSSSPSVRLTSVSSLTVTSRGP